MRIHNIFFFLVFCSIYTTKNIAQTTCDAAFTTNVRCNSVQFTPTSPIAGARYFWDFGEANVLTDTSTKQNPAYIYFSADKSGTFQYPVRLILIAGNCIDTVINTITVTVGNNALPNCSINSLGVGQVLKAPFLHCNASNINPKFTLRVENTSTTASNNTNYEVKWGDNQSNTYTPPFTFTSHDYQQMGLYDIQVTVTRQNGCVDSCHYKFFNGRNPAAGLGIPGNADLCVPATVAFDNTPGMLANPFGTVYYYKVLDCDSVIFRDSILHSVPLMPFVYTFRRSSCDPFCKMNGQFTVNITSVNLCGTEDANVTPSLSSTGEARFDMPQKGCEGEAYKLVEKSDPSFYWDANNQKCLSDMFNYWTITPSTGFTIENGSLGNEFSFQPGSDSLLIKFNVPRTYTVRLIYAPGAASPCEPDTVIHTICILPKPVARYTKTQSSPCAPATLTLFNASNTLGNCILAKYRWEVRFKNSDCGPGGAWALLNGTDTLSERPPLLRFTQPGKYLIRLYVENDCGKDEFLDSITVASTPTSVVKAVSDACPPHTVTYGIESSNFCNGTKPTYTWTIPNPVPGQPAIVFTGENPPPQTYNQPGTYTVTLQTASATGLSCGSSQTTETFVVRPLPTVAVLTSNSPVCEGNTLTISVTNPNPNYQYVWSNGQTGSSVTIPDAKEKDEGSYTVTITDNTFPEKCTRMQTISVVVNQGPSFTASDKKICEGESTTLTVTPSNYSDYRWEPSPFLTPTTGPTVNVAAPPVGVHRFVVRVTDGASNVCSGRDTVVVTVNKRPVIAFVPPDTACVGKPLQLEASPKSDGWSPSNVVSPSGLFTSNVAGLVTVNYTHVDSNNCSASRPLTVCVQPVPTAGFITNAQSGCAPLRVNVTNNSTKTSEVCFGISYRWEVVFDGAECHNGTGTWNFVSGSDTSFSPVFLFTQSGRYTLKLTVRNACGSITASQNILVGTLPEVKLAAIPNACGDTLVALSAQTKPCEGPTSLTFSWVLDGVTVSTVAQPPNQSVGVGTHTLRLTVANGCGSLTDQVSWTVRPVPPQPVLSTNSPVCEGDVVSLSVTNPSPAFQYRWSTGATGTILSLPNANSATAGTYSITVIDPSSPERCNNEQSTVVVVNPKPALAVADKSICLGSGTTLNALPANHVDYTWANSPFLESNKGPNVVVKVLPAVGNYLFTVTATGNNGCKRTDTVQVTVNPLPKLSIQTPDTACVGAPLQLQGSGDLMGTGIWINNPNVTPGGIYTPTTTGFATTVYRFTSDKGCFSDSTVRVCAQARPIANFAVALPQKCVPLTLAPTDQSNPFAACFGARYRWDMAFDSAECHGNAVGTNTQSGTNPTFNLGQTGEYQLRLKVSNGCGDSTVVRRIRVGGLPTVKIGRIPDLCGNATLDPSADASGCDAYPLNYQWILDGKVVSSQASPTGIPISQGPHKLLLRVQNDCGTAVDSVSFRVLDPPVPLAVLDTTALCLPNATVRADNRSTGSNLQYLWSVSPTPPGWGQISDPAAANPNFVFNQVGRYTLTLKVFSAVCDTVVWSQTVKINAVPEVGLATISNACNSQVVTPIPTYSLDPSFIDRVTWELRGSSGIQISNAFFPTNIPYNTNGTYTVKVSVSNRCGTRADSVSFKVLAQPQAVGSLDTTFACLPATLKADASRSTGDERQFQWDIQPAPAGWGRILTPGQAVSDLVFNQVGRYTLRVKVFNSVCDTVVWSQSLTISDKATVDLPSLPDTCEGNVSVTPRPIYSPDPSFIDRITWRCPGSNRPQITGLFFPTNILYTGSGTFTVYAEAGNRCGTGRDSVSFRIIPLPQIMATVDKTTGCVPFRANFTNVAVPNVEYVWDFGDGSPVFRGNNPLFHEYKKDGNHVLTITATDAFGCVRISAVATVRANPTPVAGFDRKASAPCGLPQTVCFPSKDQGGTNYKWSFGNGQTATEASPCIVYRDSGLFMVRQIVGNNFGCFDTATLSFRTYYAPAAGFFATVREGCEDLTVVFQDTSKFSNYAVLRYDGRRDTLRGKLTHTFRNPGNYTVTLTTGNPSGCTSEQSIANYVRVFETPVAAFRGVQVRDAFPYTFQFWNRSTFTVNPRYFWDFGGDDDGDGVPDSAFVASPKHHFRSIGNQRVTLWIVNEFGCRDSASTVFQTDSAGQLFVPNILDPHHSIEEKRVFLPKGYRLVEYHIGVYSRSGQLLWESMALENGQPKESWDGTLRGEPMPADVYVWKVHKAVFQDGLITREWEGMLDQDKVRKKENFLYLVR